MDIPKQEQLLLNIWSFLKESSAEIFISVIVIWLVGAIIRYMLNNIDDDRKRYHLKKSIRYVTVGLSFVWILLLYYINSSDLQSFHVFIFGVFLAGLAFSMRGLFSDILGWFIIISHKGFQAGDRIEIGTVRGDVIDIGILRTTLAEITDWDEGGEQSTGRMLSVKNSDVLAEPIVNYNRGFDIRWSELAVTITFESNWQRAYREILAIGEDYFEQYREIFAEKIRNVRKKHLIRYNYITPAVYIKIVDNGVTLTLRHLVEVRQRRMVRDKLFRKILAAVDAAEDVEFAYNTMRIYRRDRELQPELIQRDTEE
ncbi:MAG: mechanosensitive ion channel family protein [Fibrobacterota bacterium]